MGTHWLTGKMAPYEESSKVPLVILGPGIEANSQNNELVLLIDLLPTILDMTQVTIPDDVDGRSMLPLLHGEVISNWRNNFLIEYRVGVCCPWDNATKRVFSGIWEHTPSYKAIHTGDSLFVRWFEDDELDGNHEYELYHLPSDPYQLVNLLGGPPEERAQYSNIFSALVKRLKQLETCQGPSCRIE